MTRTRFAPSPTGYMHIGNLRTAIFEYLVAKKNNGSFILRIEDTDQSRKVPGAIDFIYNTLNLCNMTIDEGPINGGEYGPYLQSERLDIYKDYAQKLVKEKKAYYCFCTESELDTMRKVAEEQKIPFMYNGKCNCLSEKEIQNKIENEIPYVIRQKMPKEGISAFEDLVYGKIEVENKFLEDQILLKSDGYPTYNFANVIDDHLMNITHVIRGNEYLSQTPKYNLLYESFGFNPPIYIHVPMVLGEDGNKLSKRNGDASFMDLYNEGYLPEAIINYLVLLGWSPNSNKEIFTMEELIKEFDPKRISKSPSTYDLKKLQWINAQYIKKLSLDEIVKFTKPFLEKNYDLTNKTGEWINELIRIYQPHLSYGSQIINEVKLFFEEKEIDIKQFEIMTEDSVGFVLETFKNKLENITEWTVENISECINQTKDETNIKGKNLFMPIRIKITGSEHGPELPNTIFLLGQKKVINNLSL